MNSYNCPSCGAPVNFASSIAVFTVCNYCHSSLLRTDRTLEALGKMAVLKDDPTPLMLGTTGTYKGKNFSIIGRIQKTWSDGFWNEWFVYFGGNEYAWIGEAMGSYMMLFDSIAELPSPKSIDINTQLAIDGVTYFASDIKENWVTYAEGEIPFTAEYKRSSLTVDFVTATEHCASCEFEGNERRAYTGEYQSFDSLNFRNFRSFDGW